MGMEVIRKLMSRKGITSERLSELSGVPKSTIDKIVSGATDNPRYKSLRNIIYALGMNVDDFVRLADAENYDHTDRDLLEAFHSLNSDGRQRALQLLRDMMDSGNYREDFKAREQ